MIDLETHQRLSRDPLAHLIANTLAEILFATVMPHRGQAEQDLIARTSLLLADRVRFATGLPKMDAPVDPPSYAADDLTEAGEGKDTGETASGIPGIILNPREATRLRAAGFPHGQITATPDLPADPTAIRQALTKPEHTWLKDPQ